VGTIDRTIGSYHDSSNARIRKIGRYVGPASYATGGDSLTPGALGLGKLEHLSFELAINSAGTVRGLVYDHANETVFWVVLDTGAEVANGTDLSGYSARFEAIGY
jgi:hypothetical protein